SMPASVPPSVQMATCAQPPGSMHMSAVHGSLSSQFGVVPAMQVLPLHVSRPLHAVPSEHAVPAVAFACWQPPVAEHVSLVHGLLSLQFSAVPAVQTPAMHDSAPLQRSLSRHAAPSANARF